MRDVIPDMTGTCQRDVLWRGPSRDTIEETAHEVILLIKRACECTGRRLGEGVAG